MEKELIVNWFYYKRKKVFVVLLFFMQTCFAYSQFAGPIGHVTSTAIHKDSVAFKSWANSCVVTRGYQDVANTSLGYVSVGVDTNGIGKAGDNPVVTLGDGGSATLTFPVPISDGIGADFAVFENAFDDGFLELAFVEVSSDGINYFRFPAVSNTQTQTQIGPYDYVGDATMINNLAGKYRALYGTPFDLNELQGISGLDIQNITHVKIIDVVGSVNPLYASYDVNGNAINDPYPTSFPNGGFDLDAVGVINQAAVGFNKNEQNLNLSVFPNPTTDKLYLHLQNQKIETLQLYDTKGQLLNTTKENHIEMKKYESGVYILKAMDDRGFVYIKRILKN
jgi:hypothetical protein